MTKMTFREAVQVMAAASGHNDADSERITRELYRQGYLLVRTAWVRSVLDSEAFRTVEDPSYF